jgi:uncharacterized coiled-coil protein SlyX
MGYSNSKEEVVEVFKTLGTVIRVDFININKKPGFVENVNAPLKAAFVHLINLTELGKRVNNMVSEGQTHKIGQGVHSSDSEYWLILQAHSPIQETMMNRSQIVENCRILEKKVNEQSTTIQTLELKVESLQQDLDGVKNVLYQLLGGLYHQRDQSSILNVHLQQLYPHYQACGSDENVSEWDIWPTTRQGDNNQVRIAALEKKLAEIYVEEYQQDNEDKEVSYEEEQDTALLIRKQRTNLDDMDESISISTHSSMPSLIENDSSDEDF